MFGWHQEARSPAACAAAGWAGAMSVPREVTVDDGGALHLAPVAEVASLRREGGSLPASRLEPGGVRRLPVTGDQLDLELGARLEPGATLQVRLRCTPDDAEATVLELHRPVGPGPALVRLDRTRSTLAGEIDVTEHRGPFEVGPAGDVSVRVLLDHSVIEVFVNGRALSSRVYPTRSDALGVAVAAAWLPPPAPGQSGPGVEVDSVTWWRMADAVPR